MRFGIGFGPYITSSDPVTAVVAHRGILIKLRQPLILSPTSYRGYREGLIDRIVTAIVFPTPLIEPLKP